MEDTERYSKLGAGRLPGMGYSGLDPMEDTESLSTVDLGHRRAPGYSGLDPMEDTERVTVISPVCAIPLGYSGLDPMEDTESGAIHVPALGVRAVTVGSIRWRILEALFSGLLYCADCGLQWARSDGGY